MSEPLRPEGSDRCELEPVTCWPLIYGAAGLAVTGVLVVLGVFFADALRPLPRLAEAPAPQTKVVGEAPAPTIDRGPDVAPAPPQAEKRATYVNRWVRDYTPLPPVPERREEWPSSPPGRRPLQRKAGRGSAVKSAPFSYAYDEKVLREMLLKQSRELDLETEKGAGKKLLEAGKEHFARLGKVKEKEHEPLSLSSPLETLLKERGDLKGLPLLAGKACQTSTTQAEVMGTVSLAVRRLQARSSRRTSVPVSSSHPELGEMNEGLRDYLTQALKRLEIRPLHVRPLEQMYQTESAWTRTELVKALGAIKSDEATRALARRAAFDLSEAVRRAALNELKSHDRAAAREVFLEALKHPWEPAGLYAAHALVALEDSDAAPALRELADLPDPALPARNRDGVWQRRELVRVNHLRNCLLCHAPSVDRRDLVRGPIPTPGEPLPEVYYGKSRSTVPMVRADIVYFRQDFSTMHKVEKPNKWPEVQRFDYLVQTRQLSEEEAEKALAEGPKPSLRREAIRLALAQLKKERIQPED